MTPFIKVFPCLATLFGLAVAVVNVFNSTQPLIDRIGGVIWVLLICALVYWTCFKLKAVSLDESNLYVSNYLKEITVSLSEIGYVYQIIGGNGGVVIHLKSASEFGRTIMFLPTWQPFVLFSQHPIVNELRRLTELENKRVPAIR
jgi:hypothetical protein